MHPTEWWWYGCQATRKGQLQNPLEVSVEIKRTTSPCNLSRKFVPAQVSQKITQCQNILLQTFLVIVCSCRNRRKMHKSVLLLETQIAMLPRDFQTLRGVTSSFKMLRNVQRDQALKCFFWCQVIIESKTICKKSSATTFVHQLVTQLAICNAKICAKNCPFSRLLTALYIC